MTRFKGLFYYASYLLCTSALVFLGLACGVPTDVPDVLAPDTVLVRGTILTVDPNDSVAEAMAIKDGKIVAVGSTEVIEKLVGSRTRVIDLNGMTVTHDMERPAAVHGGQDRIPRGRKIRRPRCLG